MVEVGEIVVEPLGEAMGPRPGLIDPETAFWDVHDNVAEEPRVITDGATDKEQLTVDGVTVIIRVQVFVPPGPETVAV